MITKWTDLKNWNKCTPEQKARLKAMYGRRPKITKTLHDTKIASLAKARKQEAKNRGEE